VKQKKKKKKKKKKRKTETVALIPWRVRPACWHRANGRDATVFEPPTATSAQLNLLSGNPDLHSSGAV